MFNSAKMRAGAVAGTCAGLVLALAASAGATATYDIAPVTTSISSELSANLPVILGIVGALFALGLAVRAIRKFAKV